MIFGEGRLPAMRKPFNTVQEFSALYDLHGVELDDYCREHYNVRRLESEPDEAYVSRVENVISVRRYSGTPPPFVSGLQEVARATVPAPPPVSEGEVMQAFRDDIRIALRLKRWDLVERALRTVSSQVSDV